MKAKGKRELKRKEQCWWAMIKGEPDKQ